MLHLIGAYSEGHADDVTILFDIGYEVAHVTCRIHVIPFHFYEIDFMVHRFGVSQIQNKINVN